MKERLDKILHDMGLARSRSHAKELVGGEHVLVDGKVCTKASLMVTKEQVSLTSEIGDEFKYVGRGAQKISGALKDFNVSVKNLIIADVGASTGGFTDFVLQNGAAKVYAIDVGHDQLAESLRKDPRVVNLEGVNVRHPYELDEKVDLAVVDLSYISLKLTLPTIASFLKESGEIITLVKPQFEAGPDAIGKGGIVKDKSVHETILKELTSFCFEQNLNFVNVTRSSIKGKTGNQEYFFHLRKDKTALTQEEVLEKVKSLI
jgi:23S rRNA (cytidine1920-2'-O)/16S rRNA (cytidine1409-2'-O)-methyltransferase